MILLAIYLDQVTRQEVSVAHLPHKHKGHHNIFQHLNWRYTQDETIERKTKKAIIILDM